jgi:hypothetical protein
MTVVKGTPLTKITMMEMRIRLIKVTIKESAKKIECLPNLNKTAVGEIMKSKVNQDPDIDVDGPKKSHFYRHLKVLSDENQGGSKVVSIASSSFTV